MPRDLAIVEGDGPVAEDLIGFVPLAGDEERVPRLAGADRRGDRLRPIHDRDDVLGAAHSGLYLPNDRGGVLASRIVGRDDDQVGEPRGGGAHQRPLSPVSIAAAAEEAVEPLGSERAHGFERARERVGGVRVVDENLEGLPFVHGLETPRDGLHGREAVGDRLGRRSRGVGGRECGQRVRYVERAAKAEGDRDRPVGIPNPESRACRIQPDVRGRHLRPAAGAESERRTVGMGPHPAPRRIVLIRHAGHFLRVVAAIGGTEELRFRVSVRFHVAVKVQMVLRQVGEDSDVECHAIGPILLQRVRGDLHHDGRGAARSPATKEPLEIGSLGRRVRRGRRFPVELVSDGADESGPLPACRERGPNQVRGRGLSVGPGHADQGHLAGRMIRLLGGQDRERAARALDPHLRDRRVGHVPLDDGRQGAGGRRRLHVRMAVGGESGRRDEEISPLYRARVVLHPPPFPLEAPAGVEGRENSRQCRDVANPRRDHAPRGESVREHGVSRRTELPGGGD